MAWTAEGKATNALNQLKEQERTGASQRLALLAKRHLNSPSLDLALLLSVEAFKSRDTPEARDALRSAVGSSPGLLRCLKRPPGLEVHLQFTTGEKPGLVASSWSERLYRYNWELILWDNSDSRFDGRRIAPPVSVGPSTVSLDGRTLALATYDPRTREHAVLVWDLFQGDPVATRLPLKARVEYLTISRDGRRLAAASEDSTSRNTTITCWDLLNRKEVGPLPPIRSWVAGGLVFSPDGRTLIEAHHDLTHNGAIHVSRWDFLRREQIGDPQPLDDPGSLTARTGDGKTLAVNGWDNERRRYTIRLWDFSGGQDVVKPPTIRDRDPDRRTTAWCVSPDGKVLVTATRSTIARWDSTTGKAIGQPISFPGGVQELALSADGKTLAAVSYNDDSDGSTITLWETLTEKPLPKTLPVAGHVKGVALSPDGKALAAANQALVFVWALPPRSVIENPLPLQGGAKGMLLAKDGTTLFTPSDHGKDKPGTIDRWLLSAPFTKMMSLPTQYPARAIALSPDGNTLAAAEDGSQRGTTTIERWDLSSPTPMGKAWPIQGRPHWIALDPGRNTLWTAEDNGRFDEDLKLTQLDLSSGGITGKPRHYSVKERKTPSAPAWSRSSMDFRFSPGCETAAVLDSGPEEHSVTLVQLSRSEGNETPLGPFPGKAVGMEFSPDGKTLALARCDPFESESTIRFLDVASGEPILKPLTQKGVVRHLALSADGESLAAAGYHGRARHLQITLWNIRIGDPAGTLQPFSTAGGVRSMAFREDGKILCVHIDDAVHLWDLELDSWVRRAGELANRPLTDDERRRFAIPEDSP
jgi:WD40 repeat protein